VPEQTVSIECDACNAHLSIPLRDIPEDAPLSQIARAFLEEHRGCPISIEVRQS
jgi:hypothetical protein